MVALYINVAVLYQVEYKKAALTVMVGHQIEKLILVWNKSQQHPLVTCKPASKNHNRIKIGRPRTSIVPYPYWLYSRRMLNQQHFVALLSWLNMDQEKNLLPGLNDQAIPQNFMYEKSTFFLNHLDGECLRMH